MSLINIPIDKDSYMDSVNPNTNYGNVTIKMGVAVVVDQKGLQARAIGNFDVSILSGKTINSAVLYRSFQGGVGTNVACTVYRCTRPATWTEAGVTWNKYDGTNVWTAAGGDMDGTTPTPVAFQTGDNPLTGLVNFVTDALNNRNGIVSLILRLDNESPGESHWIAWENQEQSSGSPLNLPWYLQVNYVGPVSKSIFQNQAVNIASTY